MVELGVQFIGAEEVTGGVPGGPSMVAFNLCVTGVEEDGLASVAVGEKERRPSGTDSHVEELVGGSPGDGGAEISDNGGALRLGPKVGEGFMVLGWAGWANGPGILLQK
jgi:hypothetical protein